MLVLSEFWVFVIPENENLYKPVVGKDMCNGLRNYVMKYNFITHYLVRYILQCLKVILLDHLFIKPLLLVLIVKWHLRKYT